MKAKEEPRVAIIILNWNGFDDTVECLDSILRLTYKNHKSVLVDNGSGNDEGIRLKELFPEIELIQNESNLGFAGGSNKGLAWAIKEGFEYLVTLNNDCIVDDLWLQSLLFGVKSSGADFASSRIMFYPQKEVICSDGDIIYPDGSGIAANRGEQYDGGDEVRNIASACGAGSIFSAKCLEDVMVAGKQIFDEMYFAYYEDIDLALRLNSRGYRGVVVPTAVVYHKHSKTSGRYSEFKIFHSEKNRILNEMLNFPIYLIVLGELFFVVKNIAAVMFGFFRAGAKSRRYTKNISIKAILVQQIKARMWILKNFSSILDKRGQRKKNGFIGSKIFYSLNWDFLKFAK